MKSLAFHRCLPTTWLAACAVFGVSPAVAYEVLRVDTDTGLMVTETCNPVCYRNGLPARVVWFNGATIRSGAVVDGVRRFHVRGDFVVNPSDVVTSIPGTSRQYGASFQVGNNALLRGTFQFGASGSQPGAGGGSGGQGGAYGGVAEELANAWTPSGQPLFGAAGGAGGAAQQAAFFSFGFGLTWWANFTSGANGSKGNDARPGFAGLAGAAGAAGAGGAAGGQGVNNRAQGVGQGGAGGAPGAAGLGGAGGAAGTGGAGGAGFKLYPDPDGVPTTGNVTILGGDRPGTGGAGGVGQAGQAGGQGGQAGYGTNATNRVIPADTGGGTVLRRDAVLFGGNGGGGSGQGGQGGQGGGGGQGGWGGGGGGSGGGNWCRDDCGALVNKGSDKPGGSGGTGGIGGIGGVGGSGGGGAEGTAGGGGGGAVEVIARGVVRMGGTWQANGANGESLLTKAAQPGAPGTPGTPGYGETLGQRGPDYVQAGGTGGVGGTGGAGGAGGRGGASNWAGGGSGGSIKVTGAVIIDEGATVDVGGGFGGVPGIFGPYTAADAGRMYFGANARTPIDKWWAPPGLRIVSETTGQETGSVGLNPYLRAASPVETGYIPGSFEGKLGLQFGAELFGMLDQGRQDVRSEVQRQLQDWMPVPQGAGLMLARLDRLSFGALSGHDFPDYDWLMVAHGGTEAIHDPMLGIGLDGLTPSLTPLMQGSFYLDPDFGGTGLENLDTMLPGSVWLTLVPRSAGPLDVALSSLETGVLRQSLGSGQMAFESVTAVPEPGTWALMLAGLLALVVVRRRSAATASTPA